MKQNKNLQIYKKFFLTKPFVVLSSQRTGSTFIRLWLNAHSQINCHGEVFLGHYRSPDGFPIFCKVNNYHRLLFTIHQNPIIRKLGLVFVHEKMINQYLCHLLYDPKHPAPWLDINHRHEYKSKQVKSYTGFKLMYVTLKMYPQLRSWFIKNKPYVIHIYRKNRLKQFVSQCRMSRDHIDHVNESSYKHKPVHIDLRKFNLFIKENEQQYITHKIFFSSIGHYMEISYEGFFNDPVGCRRQILQFLKLDDEEMKMPKIKRISSKDISDEIENYNQVLSWLTASKYSHYLNGYEVKG